MNAIIKKLKTPYILVGLLAVVLIMSVFLPGLSEPSQAQSVPTAFWPFQCIDTMKDSRDASQDYLSRPNFGQADIAKEIAIVKDLGATCVSIGTPYDEEFFPLLNTWAQAAHQAGLKVWFRGNFSGWEGWFNHPKFEDSAEHHAAVRQFILNHGNIFRDGDIFTPAPEAENGMLGNPWQSENSKQVLRSFVTTSYQTCVKAMSDAGAHATCGYFSANGDVARGIYTSDTLSHTGGVVVIDHYVNSVARMGQDIESLYAAQHTPVVLGEFGAPIPDLNGSMSEDQQAEYVRELLQTFYIYKNHIGGLNYWVLKGGTTALINSDGTPRKVVEVIKDYFQPGVVKGVVRNSIGQTIGGAIVRTEDGVQTVQADKRGNFSLLLPPGRTDVTVAMKGYADQTFNLEAPRGSTIVQDFSIEPVRPSTWYKLRLRLLGKK